MYGWRCKIGVIIPAGNTVVENEFPRLTPEGVSIHSARLPMGKKSNDHRKELISMANYKNLKQCSETLRDARVDVIIYACTSGSILADDDQHIEKWITEVASVPAVTTANAVIGALKNLKLKNVALVSPYESSIHMATKSFLEAYGFNVAAEMCLEELPWAKMQSKSDLPPEISYILGRKVLSISDNKIDGLFISCTDFRAIESVYALQKDFGIPVVSANQASVWAAMQKCGVKVSIHSLIDNAFK